MIPLSSLLNSFESIRLGTNTTEELSIATEYFMTKFQETTKIFSKFDREAFQSFSYMIQMKEYNESDIVFSKDEDCIEYYFILYGDINFYEEPNPSESNKLIKTISAGTIYGHKIKDKLRFYGRAKGNLKLFSISKKKFDNLLNEYNSRRLKYKLTFLKKFFPELRYYTDDIIENCQDVFQRIIYPKHKKLFIDGEYDENVYLIIKGEVAVGKKPSRLHIDFSSIDGSSNSNSNDVQMSLNSKGKYIIIETFHRGDVFGGFSALNGNKCNYTAIVLSEELEVYRIAKSNILYYFCGNNGRIPMALKAIDSLQQFSHQMKFNYIQKHPNSKVLLCEIEGVIAKDNQRIIDESKIDNVLFEAWKSLEDLDSKLSMFKASLLKGNTGGKKQVDIFAKMKESDTKDFSKISGDATNRIVGRKLNNGLNNTQLKAISSLNSFCGVQKPGDAELSKLAEISNKMEGNKNKLTMFDINHVDPDNKSIEKEKPQESQKKEEDSVKENDSKAQKEIKPKTKRPKHSLKNLIE